MTKNGWYVVAVLMLASISANVDRQILSLLVIPIERDLHISDTQMSWLMGPAFALFYGVMGIPLATLADRWSRRNVMAWGVALWSAFTTACAVARTFAGLFLLRVGVGFGEATINAPSVSLIAEYFPTRLLGRAMSVYSLGIFFGSGVAYFVGGVIVSLTAAQGRWTLPIVGAVYPWQTVFLAVGLPGLVIALLLMTIRERRSPPPLEGDQSGGIGAYVSANRRLFATQALGFSAYASVNYGIAGWLPAFFVRTYGWDAGEAGRVQGLLTMTIGVIGAVGGGWVADAFVRRGRTDGPLLVGMVGAAGMLVFAPLYPLMPTASLAVAGLAIVNLFAALPWGPAQAAIAEMVPAPLRSRGAAVYFLALNFLSALIGPPAVAFFTDSVFRDQSAVRYSLAIVTAVGMTLTLLLLGAARAPYRATVSLLSAKSQQPTANGAVGG